MQGTYPQLFSPGKIGSVKIPNRIVFLPCHTVLGKTFGKHHSDYYTERAKGGTRLIIAGNCTMS